MIELKPPSLLCCLSAGGFDLTWGGISPERERSFADSVTSAPGFAAGKAFWCRETEIQTQEAVIHRLLLHRNKNLLLSVAGFALVTWKGDLVSPSLLAFMPDLRVSSQLYYPHASALRGLSHQATGNKFTGADWHLTAPCPPDRTNVWI